MPYPPELVQPMRNELTRLGVEELMTADDVDTFMQDADGKTALVVINSVCGCAAANARPAVSLARQFPIQPDRYVTVFAGQDLDATSRMRQYLAGIPPSSPFIALLQDGDPAFVLERRHIEGRSAQAIAMDLVAAFKHYCNGDSAETQDGSSNDNGSENASPEEKPGWISKTFRSIM